MGYVSIPGPGERVFCVMPEYQDQFTEPLEAACQSLENAMEAERKAFRIHQDRLKQDRNAWRARATLLFDLLYETNAVLSEAVVADASESEIKAFRAGLLYVKHLIEGEGMGVRSALHVLSGREAEALALGWSRRDEFELDSGA